MSKNEWTPFYRQTGFWVVIGLMVAVGIYMKMNAVMEVEETRYEEIACEHEEREDSELEAGQTKIEQECKNGKVKITNKVTYKNGKEAEREEIARVTEEEAVPEIKLIGTKEPEVEQAQETTPVAAQPQAATTTQQQSTGTSQNIDYSNEYQHGYCKDGTEVYGNPHAAGRANACYGHKGWVGN